jgi:predicted RNase H-like HicB family nuclease
MKLTLIIWDAEDGWLAGQLAEYPGAISQGKTIEELRYNLLDALSLLMEVERDRTLESAEKPFYTITIDVANETAGFAETS